MSNNTSLRGLFYRPWQSFVILISFIINSCGSLPTARADEFRLPAPGVMVHLSPEYNPPILKGIKVNPNNPFSFDFILDRGDSNILHISNPVIPAKAGPHTGHSQELGIQSQEKLKTEATKLIKYFLASLTIPENDLWVNLSPYEKNRIVPESFGKTEMGRDLLAEDYMLKQITASLIYPEDAIGKKFWKRIYEEAQRKFGTTNIPVNTFNKVWIVPDKAIVYENPKAGTAYVVQAKLKVMLEQDYLALQQNVGAELASAQSIEHTQIPNGRTQIYNGPTQGRPLRNNINALGSQIIREIVIPELTQEVNQGQNFAHLRQIYNSLILATWYKKKIKDSILEQVYADKNKTAGVGPLVSLRGAEGDAAISNRTTDTEYIYQQYLKAFKKGVYNYIKEESDPLTQQNIPRKYFSGGADLAMNVITHLGYKAFVINSDPSMLPGSNTPKIDLSVRLDEDELAFDERYMQENDKLMGLAVMEGYVKREPKTVVKLTSYILPIYLKKGLIPPFLILPNGQRWGRNETGNVDSMRLGVDLVDVDYVIHKRVPKDINKAVEVTGATLIVTDVRHQHLLDTSV